VSEGRLERYVHPCDLAETSSSWCGMKVSRNPKRYALDIRGSMIDRHQVLDDDRRANLVRAAARNNAEWCEIMCRLHRIGSWFRGNVWAAERRPPPHYPDAVTLESTASRESVLAEIDTVTPGCSVKDSFACLDLSPAGFRVLLDAQWLYRPARPPPQTKALGPRWMRIRHAEALSDWEQAWSGGDEPIGLFPAALLREQAVAILGAYSGDRVVGGAIANRSASVVGVSNLFAMDGDLDNTWRACLVALIEHFPDLPLVAYEHGAALAAALRNGFEATGALRVWVKDG
jgi:hypothetical protein